MIFHDVKYYKNLTDFTDSLILLIDDNRSKPTVTMAKEAQSALPYLRSAFSKFNPHSVDYHTEYGCIQGLIMYNDIDRRKHLSFYAYGEYFFLEITQNEKILSLNHFDSIDHAIAYLCCIGE
jgi:hypothetical protein